MTLTLIPLLAALVLAAPAPKAHDAGKPSPDEPAIHDFVLTLDNVHKYAEVAKHAQAAAATDKALAAEMKTIGETDAYNVEKAALMEKSPHVAAFLKSHGMTAREFVLIPMTLLTAGLAMAAEDMKGKPPAFVNPVNVKFVREHRAEIEKLHLMGDAADADVDDASTENDD
jgi:hypothetical protein